jgi:hypothetical protein
MSIKLQILKHCHSHVAGHAAEARFGYYKNNGNITNDTKKLHARFQQPATYLHSLFLNSRLESTWEKVIQNQTYKGRNTATTSRKAPNSKYK